MPRVNRSEADQQLVDAHGAEFLEVLARGLRTLMTFNAEHRSLTLSELSQATDLSRATVRRILYTLESLGYVTAEGRQFKLTPKVLGLAGAYLTSNDIASIMQPVVTRVTEEVNEACSAAVLDEADAVMIARASPPRIISVGLQLGFRLPAYCTAVGRVLLAGLSDDDLRRMLDSIVTRRLTSETVIDKSLLLEKVLAVREDGYSLVDQEVEEGFRSIAVPVLNTPRSTMCALHIGVPTHRAPMKRLTSEFLPLLIREASGVLPLFL